MVDVVDSVGRVIVYTLKSIHLLFRNLDGKGALYHFLLWRVLLLRRLGRDLFLQVWVISFFLLTFAMFLVLLKYIL